jgi:Domain of unknown function (DUF5979)
MFSIMVACRAAGRDIRLPGRQPPIFGLRTGRSRKLEHLPLGAQCRVVQTNSGGATKSAIEPSAAATITKAGTTITVTNRFDVGALAVRVRLPARIARMRKTVRVYVLCAAIGAPQELRYRLPHAGYETVRTGSALALGSVPAGADCSVIPLDRQLAATALISRTAVIRAGRRATLTITDHSLTPRFPLRMAAAGAPAGHGVLLDVRPDDQVTVSSRPNGGLRVAVNVVPSDGFVQIVNHSATTIAFRLGRSGASPRRGRVRPRAVAWVNP